MGLLTCVEFVAQRREAASEILEQLMEWFLGLGPEAIGGSGAIECTGERDSVEAVQARAQRGRSLNSELGAPLFSECIPSVLSGRVEL